MVAERSSGRAGRDWDEERRPGALGSAVQLAAQRNGSPRVHATELHGVAPVAVRAPPDS